MRDLGAPTSYLALEPGTSVYDAGGEEIGTVEHVLADPGVDIFDGLVVDTRPLLGGHRFADAEQVDEIYESGVVLKVGRDALHVPADNPAVMKADPDDVDESALTGKLRRAWDWISGRY
ncbi:PRC-barrel domain-containing protein [Capillimicrobium parvum]|uniref:PRC-barrel domain-containing protein n=1 Tax=Capillimicrobium parvum TaxID=2884022 RepID=UPI00216ACC80|nr:PRC-barrel domain-containing protein [Capillimicrobium parvum]